VPSRRAAFAGPHFVRFGTAADQKFLLGEFLSSYQQLMLNANIVAHMPTAMASIVTQKARNKPYILDPQTHAFQHDIALLQSTASGNQKKLRRSIDTLIRDYGSIVKDAIIDQERPLDPSDLTDDNACKAFCQGVLKFQIDTLSKEAKQSDSQKYYRYLASNTNTPAPSFRPTMVVAPYFYLTSTGLRSWLPININCARNSVTYANDTGLPLAVEIVISRGLLVDEASVNSIVAEYAQVAGIAAFLVWVDDFSEHSASAEELRRFVALIRQLANVAPVVNLYGGYFSTAIQRLGIVPGFAGVTHSLEYGEDRSVIPVGGGVPVAKFYLPSLHKRVNFRDAIRAIRALDGFASKASFHATICDCKECQKVIDDDPESSFDAYGRTKAVSYMNRGRKVTREYPLTETRMHTVSHYMHRKRIEFSQKVTASDIAARLRSTQEQLSNKLQPEVIGHCEIWASVIESLAPS